MSQLTHEAKIGFRDQFRSARAQAIADAEGFQEILYVLERLGILITKSVESLGAYKDEIQNFAILSPLSDSLPDKFRYLHTPFNCLYEILKDARNDAFHQGAYARHLTVHAIELSLVLEDALSMGNTCVADYMVKSVVVAEDWQPISYVRQIMLMNNFTFLPIYTNEWYLISDTAIAQALSGISKNKRKENLALKVKDAVDQGIIKLEKANIVSFDLNVDSLVKILNGKPFLVLDGENLIGIITSFDVM